MLKLLDLETNMDQNEWLLLFLDDIINSKIQIEKFASKLKLIIRTTARVRNSVSLKFRDI